MIGISSVVESELFGQQLTLSVSHSQEEDSLEDVCGEIIRQWTESKARSAAKSDVDGRPTVYCIR